MKKALRGNIVLPDRVLEEGLLILDEEEIAAVLPAGEAGLTPGIEIIDYGESFIAPGLLDLHVHGAMGKDVFDLSLDSLKEVAAHLARTGVTGFVPTLAAAPLSSLLEGIALIKGARREKLPAEVLGVYLEGPFLSQAKRGAQDPEFIRPATREDVDLLLQATRGLPTILTIAPEVGDNLSFVPGLKKEEVVLSIGHSAADYELARRSFELGITHATHLFNAMSGFLAREPGVVGAVLETRGITAELIADGIHVHPASLRLALRLKGADKVCLVTDSMKAAGLGEGLYRVGNLDVLVKDGQARLEESGALAGSVLTLNRAVKNIIDWTGISICEAVGLASSTPAAVLGLGGKLGEIAPGKIANLAVFNRDFTVVETILRGRFVLEKKFKT